MREVGGLHRVEALLIHRGPEAAQHTGVAEGREEGGSQVQHLGV
jgi:hypothetical protein